MESGSAFPGLKGEVDYRPVAQRPEVLPKWYEALGVTVRDPVMSLPDARQVVALLRETGGREKFLGILERRENLIRLRKTDPFGHSWEPVMWRDADALLAGTALSNGRVLGRKKDVGVIGSNRATKSHWAAHRTVKRLQGKAGAIGWCFTTDLSVSHRDQQAFIWHYFPPAWRAANGTKSVKTYISYKAKTGFSDESFIAPNGSACHFMYYEQERGKIEGGQVDWWWGDEFLPADWLETLRGRTVDRAGQGALTQTPITGFNDTMGSYTDKGEVVTWIEAEKAPEFREGALWPGGKPGMVPYIIESLDRRYASIFFQARWNLFLDYGELLELWGKSSKETKLIRWHGVTLRRAGNIFPKFGRHNVVAAGNVPSEGTNYQFIDFAWNRNWFMLWFRVWEHKGKRRIYVYREWPDFLTYGEWALRAEDRDGQRGPAQQTIGLGYSGYKELVRGLERPERLKAKGEMLKADPDSISTSPLAFSLLPMESGSAFPVGEEIFARFGDPRSGNAAGIEEEGGTTILQKLMESEAGAEGMFVQPWAGREGSGSILTGINLVNEWLEFDEGQPLGPENEPVLYVSEGCQNVIQCLGLYKGTGQKEASKDPIDLLRAAAMMDIRDVGGKELGPRGGFSY